MMTDTVLAVEPTAEIKAELESRYRARFNPPAGFRLDMTAWDIEQLHLDPEYPGEWSGPTAHGENWKITSHWTNDGGIKFWVDHAKDGKQDHEPFTPGEALEMAAALSALAQQATV